MKAAPQSRLAGFVTWAQVKPGSERALGKLQAAAGPVAIVPEFNWHCWGPEARQTIIGLGHCTRRLKRAASAHAVSPSAVLDPIKAGE